MTTAATPRPLPAAVPPASRVARALERIAAWLELYAQATLRIARIGTVIGASIAAGVEAFNVFTRYVLGYSLFGADAALTGVVGGAIAAALVWLGAYGILAAGASKLVALGLIFVALTLAATPVVFMLLMVGLTATFDIFALHFYPTTDTLFPWRT